MHFGPFLDNKLLLCLKMIPSSKLSETFLTRKMYYLAKLPISFPAKHSLISNSKYKK